MALKSGVATCTVYVFLAPPMIGGVNGLIRQWMFAYIFVNFGFGISSIGMNVFMRYMNVQI